MEAGFEEIILGIGGSATNDGGAGMAQALGFNLLDKNNCPIGLGGGSLLNLKPDRLFQCSPTSAKGENYGGLRCTKSASGTHRCNAGLWPAKRRYSRNAECT